MCNYKNSVYYIIIISLILMAVSCGNVPGKTIIVPLTGQIFSPDTGTINWLGSFAVAPADPEKNDAYFNSADGNSYIFNGTVWDLLARRGADGADGADGTTINWLGSFAAAPGSPSENDAYCNTADGNSYIYSGSTWEILAQHGVNGIDGSSINWLGNLASDPVSPSKYDAYYNTTDGNSYIYTGTAWQVLAHHGSNGIDGVSVNWLGDLSSAPLFPSKNDAYYNTTTKITYIYNGTAWDLMCKDGAAGTNGTNGISILWLGSFTGAPSSPSLNNAYYNTTTKKSYIWDGSAWQVIAQDGAPAVVWVDVTGTSATAQSNYGYIADNASQVTITLPLSPVLGDVVKVTGAGAGGWKIAQNAGQKVITKNVMLSYGAIWTAHIKNLWTCVASSSDGTKLVAGTNGYPIYTSTDSGATWTARESGRLWIGVASSSDGTKLVTCDKGGQIYTSTDSGVTWTPRDSSRLWEGVASSSDGSKLAALVDAGHIYTSTDSGVTWSASASSPVLNWQGVASSSDGTKLAAAAHNGFNGHVYTSSDSGATWTLRESSSKLWGGVASSSDGTKLAAVTAGSSGQIYTSTDSGVTWTASTSTPTCNWHSIASSADGTKLAAGVYGGYIYTSTDSGINWTANGPSLVWLGIAMSSNGSKLAAVTETASAIDYVYTSVYTTSIQSTTAGTTGYITGAQYDSIELQYVGGNTYTVTNYAGNLYVY